MSDKPTSPFARLDTNLMRSTSQDTPTKAQVAPALIEDRSAPRPAKKSRSRDAVVSSHHDTKVSTKTPRYHDTAIPRNHDDMVDTVRRAVKSVGKEAATLRLSAEEKRRLSDIIYTYKRQGKRTSETELIRIALNYVLAEYEVDGEASLLARVLDALDA
jgi:hypothetical protein